MSEEQKGDARAQGAFHNWLAGMTAEMNSRNRSPEYVAQFWKGLRVEMENYLGKAPQ